MPFFVMFSIEYRVVLNVGSVIVTEIFLVKGCSCSKVDKIHVNWYLQKSFLKYFYY